MQTNNQLFTEVDIAFSFNDSIGAYDISLDDSGQLVGTSGFDTALLMTVLCEQRATVSQVSIPHYRRGWWGNTLSDFANFQIGSLLWLYYQARNNDQTTSGIITALQDAFMWFIQDGYLTDVKVNAISSNCGVNILIDLINNNLVVNSISFNLWENTAVIK